MADNKSSTGLKILIVILIVLLGVTVWQFIDKQNKLTKLEVKSKRTQMYLQAQRDSLRKELLFIRDRYDSLETNNDSINLKLEIQKAKINKLLDMRADNLWLIHKYKKEIGTLREVLKSYVIQVDSLLQIKQELTAENKEVKTKLKNVEDKKEELEKEKEDLSSKVKEGAVVMAKNINVVGINEKNKEKSDIDNMDKLKMCFTLRENKIAEAGPRLIYARITRPDDVVLTSEPDNLITIDNEKIVYTAKREINYQNQDIDMCIYYDNGPDELIEGEYELILYSGGSVIGQKTFFT